MKDRALFLDRDGTIIIEKDFIADPAEVELIDGAVEALVLAVDNGFKLFMITNQSGVARGLMTEKDVRAVNQRVQDLLTPAGIRFDGAFYCPHYPPISGPCDCRKPGRGMIDQALRSYDIDLGKSFVIGDRLLDIGLAHNIGATAVMVRTGYGATEENQIGSDGAPHYIANDLLEAVNWITREMRS